MTIISEEQLCVGAPGPLSGLKCPMLDVSLGRHLRAVSLSPELGSSLGMLPARDSLSLPLPLPLLPSLPQLLKKKK